MSQNRVSINISEQQQTDVFAAIKQIESQLEGLISFIPGERRSMPMMGPKSDRFARGIVRGLQQNPSIAPEALGLSEAIADLDALDKLIPILDGLKQVTSRVEDTVAALGSDVMAFSYSGYNLLKTLGNAHGLDDLLKELGYRFERSRKKGVVAPE